MPSATVATSEERRIELLSALAACDGSPRRAVKRLAEQGTETTEAELKEMRTTHAGSYHALAVERGRSQEEAITQEFRELTIVSQRATRLFVEEIADALEEGGLENLPSDIRRQIPQAAGSMAKIMQVSVDKLLSITGRPQDGSGGDPLEHIQTLIKLNVLKPVDRPAVDGTAEEVGHEQ